MKLDVGKLYDVTWVDITEDPSGSPDKLAPCVMTHTWRYHSTREHMLEGGYKVKCMAFTSSKPDRDGNYYHAVVLPTSVVLHTKPATRS